jgi:hypothetical protein
LWQQNQAEHSAVIPIGRKFAKKHQIIQSNPFMDFDPIKKTKGTQKRPLTIDEIQQFVAILDDFWKPLFIVMFFPGSQVAEATVSK